MNNKQIFFYGLKEDFIEIFKSVESSFNIKYAQAGLFDDKVSVSSVRSLVTSDDIDDVEYGDWNNNKKYLLLPKENDIQIRSIPQKKGGIKYAVDQMKNEDSVVFYIGGIYKDNAVIASKIATISNTEFTKSILKYLTAYIKKNFDNINGFYVSPKALKESEKGLRLTTDINASLDYDLAV